MIVSDCQEELQQVWIVKEAYRPSFCPMQEAHITVPPFFPMQHVAEAITGRRLAHPHVVHTYAGVDHSRFFIVSIMISVQHIS